MVKFIGLVEQIFLMNHTIIHDIIVLNTFENMTGLPQKGTFTLLKYYLHYPSLNSSYQAI